MLNPTLYLAMVHPLVSSAPGASSHVAVGVTTRLPANNNESDGRIVPWSFPVALSLLYYWFVDECAVDCWHGCFEEQQR